MKSPTEIMLANIGHRSVVIGGDSGLRHSEFKSRHRILQLSIIFCKIVTQDSNVKDARDGRR